MLKRILKEFSSYNFDTVIDRDTRLKSVDKLILAGGKWELYDGSKAIALHIHNQLAELQAKGIEILLNYMSNPRRYVLTDNTKNNVENGDHQKIKALLMKIFEIANLLNPFAYDPSSYVEMLTQGSNRLIDKHAVAQLSRFYETDNIDRLLSNEINSLYYLGLVNENEFQVMYPMVYLAQLISKAEDSNLKNSMSTNQLWEEKEDRYSIMPNSPIPFLLPKERLLSIIKNDVNIRQWYSEWLGDLIKYQNKTLNQMNTLHKDGVMYVQSLI